MKSLLATVLLLTSVLATRPTLAHPFAPARAIPQAAGVARVRPLTRYLAAMLRLTPKQAAAVQQALRTHRSHSLTPEELRLNLELVLSLEAQQRLQALQTNATSYQMLAYLAARH